MWMQIIRWDDKEIKATFSEAWVPIDITDYEVYFTVKSKGDTKVIDATDTNAVIKKDIFTHSNPTAWETTIVLSSSDTDIPAKEYIADLQLKSPAGKISSTTSFDVTIIQEITQRS